MTVHSRLKTATADLHVEVESTMGLDKITRSGAAYSETLGILYVVFDRAYKKLAAIDQIFSSDYDSDRVIPAMVIILRLLQFTLVFRGTWNVRAKE